MSAFERLGVAICSPIPMVRSPIGTMRRELITVEWHRAVQSLGTPTNYNRVEFFIDGYEVGDARNQAAKRALDHNPKPKYLFFLDYDVLPHHDALCKLIYRAEHFADYDIFAGVYCSKTSPPEPLIYRGDGQGPAWDWTVGDLLFDVTGVHMGLTLIRTSLFEKLSHTDENPWFFTTNQSDGSLRRYGTEDLWFCRRAIREAGAKILVDTSVLAGHILHSTGQIFGLPDDSHPVKSAQWLQEEQKPRDGILKALDLGVGTFQRSWPYHETHTVDIRPEVNPTYVMDTRYLNLADNSFDLVASSHHLEHIGRLDQERVWSEMFRVCKPGGHIEHIVPNVRWAAQKVEEVEAGRDDDGFEAAFNVLYGAQEAHGYERLYNTHFFAYTPSIAKALAEQAGFVDVQTEDWLSNPDLGYNLVIRGRKPEVVVETKDEEPQSTKKTPWQEYVEKKDVQDEKATIDSVNFGTHDEFLLQAVGETKEKWPWRPTTPKKSDVWDD